jgi:hypothetical protein
MRSPHGSLVSLASPVLSGVAFTAITLLGTAAFADEPAAAAFATMDDTGDGSKLDAELGLGFASGEDSDDVAARLDLHGQFVAAHGFGAYVGVAATSYVSDQANQSFDSVGNFQLGAMHRTRLAPAVDVGVRAGFILPTGSGDRDIVGHQVGTVILRPSDAATAVPDSTWLRLGVSPTYRAGSLFVRADLGVDLPMASGGDEMDLDVIGRGNLGVGFVQGGFAASAELQNVAAFDDEDGGSDWIHTAALSMRGVGRTFSPFFTVSSPLDDGLRGNALGVTLGMTAAM